MILVIRTFRIFSNKGFPIYVYKALKENKKLMHSMVSIIQYLQKIAEAINEIIQYRKTGIINIAGERISRYELALKIKEKFNLDGIIKEVDNVKSWVAKRPFDSSLDISKAKKLLSIDFYSLDENLNYMMI